ncbi:MAG: methyltransferase [Thermoleophilaceae bacterium]|nr:methyltransferase [Thermoleophilaceae bacterium]
MASTEQEARTRGLDAYRLDAYIPERLVEEMCDGRMLGRLLVRKLGRRVVPRALARQDTETIVTSFAGIAVFDRPDLHKGGLSFGQDFPRVLNELGVSRVTRLFEYCAGPGYIGYSLLANGWCESLVLSDISPAGVAAARRTAAHNEIEDRVAVYESDALDQIPAEERWDLVVSNPPHFLPDATAPDDIQVFDEGWKVHARFYESVGRHMRPGGRVVMVENSAGSDPRLFEQMIRDGGGRPLKVHEGTDVNGRPNGLYYQVSEW